MSWLSVVLLLAGIPVVHLLLKRGRTVTGSVLLILLWILVFEMIISLWHFKLLIIHETFP
jgi:hypothetical protein